MTLIETKTSRSIENPGGTRNDKAETSLIETITGNAAFF